MSEQTGTIIVSNVAQSLSLDNVRDIFAECGEILDIFEVGEGAHRVFRIVYKSRGMFNLLFYESLPCDIHILTRSSLTKTFLLHLIHLLLYGYFSHLSKS